MLHNINYYIQLYINNSRYEPSASSIQLILIIFFYLRKPHIIILR